MNTNQKNNGPEAKFKAGAVTATIWKNSQDSKFSYFSVNIERNYKDKQGVWKHTGSMRLNDLPKASLVLNKAYEFLATAPTEDLNNSQDSQGGMI